MNDMRSRIRASLGADWPEHIRAILTRLETGSDILYTSNFHRDHREAQRAGRHGRKL
jgi:hypothetical protein